MSDLKSPRPVLVRRLGLQDYRVVFEAMQSFTSTRLPATPDELWLLEHYPVFTLGLNGKPEHLLAPGDIPVIRADRGGQVTYHGPGQLVVYLLMDVKRARLGVRALITALEQSVIQLLAGFAVRAYSRAEAPGVYVEAAKVASVGMRIRRGCSYHGLSLNVAMDLEPFARINPCGYAGLRVTQLQDLGIKAGLADIAERLPAILVKDLGYTHCQAADSLPPLPYLETRHA